MTSPATSAVVSIAADVVAVAAAVTAQMLAAAVTARTLAAAAAVQHPAAPACDGIADMHLQGLARSGCA